MKVLLKIIIFFIFFLASPLYANISLPRLFTDNMVLQRNEEINIWGWADAYEKVEITMFKKKYKAQADKNGKWLIKLPAKAVGGPYKMLIKGKNTIELKNIMFGDVWVCSGQSNMYFRVAAAKNSYLDINDANYENIRLFQIDKDANYQPKDDLASGEWLVCTPETVRRFSAVAYFFGRTLHDSTHVPIGLIHASWGGSLIQAWMPTDAFKEFPAYFKILREIEQTTGYFEQLEKKYKDNGGNLVIKELYKQDKGFNEDGSLADIPFTNKDVWQQIKVPGYWEDQVLQAYNGTIWYRKQIEMPKAFDAKDLLLDIGWVDDYDFTFFNGEKVGSTWYKGSERSYVIPKEIVRQGMNEILVCVYDYSGKGGFWGPRKSHIKINDNKSDLQIDLQGIWYYSKGLDAKNFKTDILPLNKQPQKRSTPTFLYNAMIAPIIDFAIKGAIWYQGERNAGNAEEYKELFPALIQSWRSKWGQGDTPFLFVQLANYGSPADKPANSNWAALREAQLKTLSVGSTGMAVTIDLGNSMNIHPTNKQDVGKRLALAALHFEYDKQIVYSGPVYESMKINNGKIYLKFKNTGSGLVAKSKHGYLNEFVIAGVDEKFVWAKAYIENGQVVVYNKEISDPVAVRYAWTDNPNKANLYNVEGLPATPFRTDDWGLIK